MNAPWIIGTLLAIAFFAYFEKRAFDYPNAQYTLSHYITSIGKNWPLSIWLMGLFCGILAAHFFWPWCANPLGSGGG